jgi:large subunit ribosomal protein L30e
MSAQETIQESLKSKKIVIGYKESIKFIKVNTPKLIVISNNLPESLRKEIEHNAKVGNMKMEVFDGNSKELGIFCGKPFPVSALVIKG